MTAENVTTLENFRLDETTPHTIVGNAKFTVKVFIGDLFRVHHPSMVNWIYIGHSRQLQRNDDVNYYFINKQILLEYV